MWHNNGCHKSQMDYTGNTRGRRVYKWYNNNVLLIYIYYKYTIILLSVSPDGTAKPICDL